MLAKETSRLKEWLAMSGFWLLVLSGLLAFIEVAASGTGDLMEWLKPLAPWSVASIAYVAVRNLRRSRGQTETSSSV